MVGFISRLINTYNLVHSFTVAVNAWQPDNPGMTFAGRRELTTGVLSIELAARNPLAVIWNGRGGSEKRPNAPLCLLRC